MAIKDNILKYIELKGISKSEFYRRIGAANGLLDKGKGINGNKLGDILREFPDINPEWLLTGQGSMFKDQGLHNNIVIGDGSAAGNNNQVGGDAARVAFLEEQVQFYREKIAFLEKQIEKKE